MIKKYIVDLVFSITGNPEVVRQHKNILTKCNSILVQIIKQEWNSTWPNAIKDLADACEQNQALCENNLEIMQMLSEEIFEETRQNMTAAQVHKLKLTFGDNLKIIYNLCEFIASSYIQNSNNISPGLIKTCVKVLYSFITWAPAEVIFATGFLDKIMIGLLPDPKLTVLCLQSISESYSINLKGGTAEELEIVRRKVIDSSALVATVLQNIFPIGRTFKDERVQRLKNHNQLTLFDNFSKEIAIMISALFKHHFSGIFEVSMKLYKSRDNKYLSICETMQIFVQYMINLSSVDNDPLYKICAEFWQIFLGKKVEIDQYYQKQFNKTNVGLNLDNTSYDAKNVFKKIFNSEQFNELFKIIISKMPRPEEVLIEIDESGIPRKVEVENTDNSHLFSVVKQTLGSMTSIDWDNMNMHMLNMINKLNQVENFSPEALNGLSWAIGSLSGYLDIKDETHCLTNILRVAFG